MDMTDQLETSVTVAYCISCCDEQRREAAARYRATVGERREQEAQL